MVTGDRQHHTQSHHERGIGNITFLLHVETGNKQHHMHPGRGDSGQVTRQSHVVAGDRNTIIPLHVVTGVRQHNICTKEGRRSESVAEEEMWDDSDWKDEDGKEMRGEGSKNSDNTVREEVMGGTVEGGRKRH